MAVEILEREDLKVTDDGSHDKFSHIVLEGWNLENEEGGQEFYPETPVVDAMVNGTRVRALCGKIWQPGDNPDKYRVCPTCIEIAKERGWTVPKQ
jgi:Protein of unknown function (DUF3039)